MTSSYYEEGNSKEEILKRMKLDVSSDVNKLEGSFIHDVLAPSSIESFNRFSKLDDLLNKAIPQWSSDKFLDMHTASRGIFRKLGNFATGEITVTGAKGTLVYLEMLVQTLSGMQYITLQETTIPDSGTVQIPIQAVSIGKQYNTPANTIIQIPARIDEISGIIDITNKDPTEGGTDAETDDELKTRLLEKVQNPSSSGNKKDYERWAKEVEGVIGVKVVPLWNGGGTVKLICYGENGALLDNTILQNIKDHIDPEPSGEGEGEAPIGAHVTIITSTNKIINVDIVGFQGDKTNVQLSLQNYINALKPGDVVKNINISASLTNAQGVIDFTNVKLNGISGNILTTDEEKPILGVITYE